MESGGSYKTCPFCAEEIQTATINCQHCGRKLVKASEKNGVLSDPSKSAPVKQKAEKSFFNQGDVEVTSTRVVIGSKTYALRNNVSVQMIKAPPSSFSECSTFLLNAGAFAAITGIVISNTEGWANSVALSGFAACIVGLWLLIQKSKTGWIIMRRDSTIEKQVLTSDNEEYIQQVFNAIHDAIDDH